MRMNHFGTVVVLGALAMGCDPASPLIEPAAVVLASQGVGPLMATGGGKAELPAGFSALKFSFNAKALPNGTVNGQFRQRYESASGIRDFHGEVTCLSVDPANGRAWVGGVITQNNSTAASSLQPQHAVGRDVWFRVVDYGEGAGVVDRTTVLGFEGGAGFITSAEYCAAQPWAAGDANTWPVRAGNIQVR